MSFGSVLKSLRCQAGMSLADMAAVTHYSKGYLSNVENGRKQPTPELVDACGKALNASESLLEALRVDQVAKADATPWQTAELLERLTASDVSSMALESLHSAVTELCCQYSYRDAVELRTEAHGWIDHVGKLLRQPVGLRAHTELMTAAGWLALLVGCVEWDMGLKVSAEYTRKTAQSLAQEAGHFEQLGWAYEMEAWYALTQERYEAVIKAAQAGQQMTKGTSVHVQLIAQETKARASLGETDLPRLLEKGRSFLDHLPPPDRPDNHFKIDPSKLEFYEMDAYRMSGRDDMTKQYGEIVVTQNRFPMRVTQARLALAVVSAREGDLEAAVGQAMEAISENRRSLPAFKLLSRQLAIELGQRFPGEVLTSDYQDVVRSL